MSNLQFPDRSEAEGRAQIAASRLQKLLSLIDWHSAFLKGMNDNGAGLTALAGHASVAMAEIIKAKQDYDRVAERRDNVIHLAIDSWYFDRPCDSEPQS